MKRLAILAAVTALAGCASAPPLSSAAQQIQLQPSSSTLLARCKMLGPVSGSASAFNPQTAEKIAIGQAREQAASLGADVVATTNRNVDTDRMAVTVQGTAMKCY